MRIAFPDFFLTLTAEPPPGLRAWARSCGAGEVVSEGYRYEGDYPTHAGRSIFQYTLEGTGFLRFRGVEHTLPAGHAMLLQPPDAYCYHARDGVPWRFVFLTLDGPDAAAYWREIIERHGPVQKLVAGSPPIRFMLKVIRNRLSLNAPPDPWTDGVDAYRFALGLLREVEKRATVETSTDVAIHRAVDHVQRQIAGELDVDALARVSGLSRYHFSRRFRACTGLPPGEYILRARLERARHLLDGTHDTVREIAFAVGFRDPNYFTRIFREREGMTPTTYRRARRGTNPQKENGNGPV